ncbi:peptidoglycan/LPS O-acetylase OafA/YrhL [Nakamurella sp. UYEF19]|uniref:acyltransferase family protein n=1 Tax=Nakamurella sp. UYEF19 TaxID=1756392 RepID=UPI00339863D9
MAVVVTERPGEVALAPLPALPPGKRKSGFRPDIEGLRAAAVVSVILDHLFSWPSGGFVGVDVFFVISGFLITGLLLEEYRQTGRISFTNFYRRRIRRIMPVSTVVLLCTVAATYFVFTTARARTVGVDAIWAFLFSANWHFAVIGTDYWQADGPVSPLQHYWSLAVEEQFYFVWPIVLVIVLGLGSRLGWRASRAAIALAGLLLALAAVSFADSLWETTTRRTWAYFSTPSRAWELAVGALLAVGVPLIGKISLVVRTVVGWCGLAGIAAAMFLITSDSAFPAPWAAVPVLAAAAVIISGTGPTRPTLWPLTNPVSRYLGMISYSLYLWHFPIIVLLAAFFSAGDKVYFAVALIAMLALSVLSFHLIEDPVRRSRWLDPHRGRRPSPTRRSRRAPLGVKLSAIVLLAMVAGLMAAQAMVITPTTVARSTIDTAGADPEVALTAQIGQALAATTWPSLSPTLGELSNDVKATEWVKDGCLGLDINSVADPVKNAQKCVYGDAGATKTAVLLGDSIAISYLPAIRSALAGHGWKIDVMTVQQCPIASVPVLQVDQSKFPQCDAFRAWALDRVDQIKPDLVIAASAENTVSRLASGATQGAGYAELAAGEKKTLLRLSRSASRIELLAPPPIGQNLQKCASKVSKPSDCTAGPAARRDQTVTMEQNTVGSIPGGKVAYFDTTPWFCSADLVCPAFVGTTPVFADGAHLTDKYSKMLAPVMGELLLGTSTTRTGSGAATPTAAAHSGSSAAVGSAAAALQADVVRALSATVWPALSPSMEQEMTPRSYPEDNAGCTTTDLTNPDSCSFGSRTAKTIVVFGDSIALKLIPTVRAAFGDTYRIKGIVMAGCPLIDFPMSFPDDGNKAHCLAFRARAVTAALSAKPDVVIITDNYGATALNTGGEDNSSAWQRGATTTVGALLAGGTKVLLVTSPPKGPDLQSCYTKLSTPSDCTTKISTSWTDGFRAEQAVALATGAKLIDTHLWYCSADGYCPSFSGTTPTKIDPNHTTAEYAALLAPAFREAVAGDL